ncbi:MAG TPA: NFACT RNA binding domain-containing protein [Clostridiales bacterium]|nr:NFACT RNA binding domain-containing protein [Clostridiales bacterium]
MPLDGIVADCIVLELENTLTGGRIDKIFQPEPDEIVIYIRARGVNNKLLLSANPNYPRIHLTEVSKNNPSNPPVFCMLLRKHLSGGKVLGFDFHNYERIISINIESINELGDLSAKKLIIEIMGRHSNIILVNENGKIIDSIKHVSSDMSRVREVMPAREYVLPPGQDKINPLNLDMYALFGNESTGLYKSAGLSVEKYLLNTIKGFSPFLCREICLGAGINGKQSLSEVVENSGAFSAIKDAISAAILRIRGRDYRPYIVFQDNKLDIPLDFHCLPLNKSINKPATVEYFSSISQVLDVFYSKKDFGEKLNHKKSVLIRVLDTHLDRCNKKLALQQESLREVSDREKLKLYGELLTAFIYSIPHNSKKVSLPNYYNQDNEYIDIPLNEYKTPQENAQIYFKRYAKAKSTFEHASIQVKETIEEIEYLECVYHLLVNCTAFKEIDEIRDELVEQEYLTSKGKTRKGNASQGNTAHKRLSGQSSKTSAMSSPLHYKSSDDFDIYVGKNNKQNDFLTFKFASSRDIWLHTRNIPGSHTIIRCQNKDIPDATLEEAAMLAALHSKAGKSSKVPVDYTNVKYVRKPSGAKPGMVIYENFKTYIVTPDEKLAEKMAVKPAQ